MHQRKAHGILAFISYTTRDIGESVLSFGEVGILDSFGKEIPFKLLLPSNLKILINDPPGQILKHFVFDNFMAAVTVLMNGSSLMEIGC